MIGLATGTVALGGTMDCPSADGIADGKAHASFTLRLSGLDSKDQPVEYSASAEMSVILRARVGSDARTRNVDAGLTARITYTVRTAATGLYTKHYFAYAHIAQAAPHSDWIAEELANGVTLDSDFGRGWPKTFDPTGKVLFAVLGPSAVAGKATLDDGQRYWDDQAKCLKPTFNPTKLTLRAGQGQQVSAEVRPVHGGPPVAMVIHARTAGGYIVQPSTADTRGHTAVFNVTARHHANPAELSIEGSSRQGRVAGGLPLRVGGALPKPYRVTVSGTFNTSTDQGSGSGTFTYVCNAQIYLEGRGRSTSDCTLTALSIHGFPPPPPQGCTNSGGGVLGPPVYGGPPYPYLNINVLSQKAAFGFGFSERLAYAIFCEPNPASAVPEQTLIGAGGSVTVKPFSTSASVAQAGGVASLHFSWDGPLSSIGGTGGAGGGRGGR